MSRITNLSSLLRNVADAMVAPSLHIGWTFWRDLRLLWYLQGLSWSTRGDTTLREAHHLASASAAPCVGDRGPGSGSWRYQSRVNPSWEAPRDVPWGKL